MTSSRTRAANDAFGNDEEEENPRRAQRRRIEAEEGAAPGADASLSLTDLNDNVLVNIMSFLTFNDLNEVELCNHRCQEIRSHESLDQTRVGTIVFSENTTRDSFENAIYRHDRDEVFTGNRTHLKVVGLEQVQNENWSELNLGTLPSLPGVLKLDVPCSQENLTSQRNAFRVLLHTLPHLRELNASNLKLAEHFFFSFSMCRELERLTWTGCDALALFGNGLSYRSNLMELMLDEYQVRYAGSRNDFLRNFTFEEGTDFPSNYYMWIFCRRLKRLSMKNATWICQDMSAPEPLAQGAIIKMVRRHPTLRWIRSDLTEENVAMLKQERPEITFVTD